MGLSLEENQPCLTWQLPQRRPLQFPQAKNAELIPLDGVREDNTTGGERLFLLGVRRSLSLAKKTHQNLGAQCSQLHQGLPTHTHPILKDLILPPTNALTLIVVTLQGWEFNLCCNSASHRMRVRI